MFRSLAGFAYDHRRTVALAFFFATVLAFAFGWNASQELVPGGFEVSNRDEATVQERLGERFETTDANMVLLYRATSGLVTEPDNRADLEEGLQELREHPSVASVISPVEQPGLLSEDGREAIATAELRGSPAEREGAFESVARDARDQPGFEVFVGGALAVSVQAQEIARSDLLRSELLALPLIIILLVVFFRGFLAALLPIALAAFSVGMSMLILRLTGMVWNVSLFTLNIVTFLGLGLAVDYGLFVVQRFREELALGREVREALGEVVATAGKAVVFSGLAVAASLLGLLWIPVLLLQSVAVIGMVVVVLTDLAVVLFLPALLGMLGHRVGHSRELNRRSQRRWGVVADFCIRHRYVVALASAAILLVFATPFARMNTAISDARVFPADTDVRVVHEALATNFETNPADAHVLLVQTADGSPLLTEDNLSALFRYTDRIEEVEGIEGIVALTTRAPEGVSRGELIETVTRPDRLPPQERQQLRRIVDEDATYIRILTSYEAGSPEAVEQLDRLAEVAPAEFAVEGGGRTVELMEIRNALSDRLPHAVITVVCVTIVVLLAAFGAVLIAIEAVFLDVLSLAASFGALVWVFQDGRFEGLLDYQSMGAIDPTIVVMIFALVFGLSMDYEMFLISRIRERYDERGDNRDAVAHGVVATGPVITRAAALLLAVVVGLMASELIFLKELGFGLGIAILVDATIVRLFLAPSTLAIVGQKNWWAPARFTRWWKLRNIGVHEGPAKI